MNEKELLERNEGILEVSVKSGDIFTNISIRSEGRYLFKSHYDHMIQRLQEFRDRALEEEPNTNTNED